MFIDLSSNLYFTNELVRQVLKQVHVKGEAVVLLPAILVRTHELFEL